MSDKIQCRGCFELGTACGSCPKCWEAMRHPWVKVPERIVTCPECCGAIYIVANSWDEETGQPFGSALQIECEHDDPESDDESLEHRYWQSDWQSVVDVVRKWCGASEE